MDGDALTVTSAATSTPGASVSCTASGLCDYTPPADFNGVDTFTYTVSDGLGGTDTATVAVSVGSVNDQPTAGDDDATVTEGGSTVIDVLANDADPDGALDPSTVVVIAGPSDGTVTVDSSTGEVTCTPDAGFTGTDAFTYEVCDDGSPSLCATAVVSITVGSVNRSPAFGDEPGNQAQVLRVGQAPAALTGGDPTVTLTPTPSSAGRCRRGSRWKPTGRGAARPPPPGSAT